MSDSTLELKQILERVVDWLKYAEAKNAALLAFNCAFLVGILQIINDSENSSLLVNYLFFLVVLLFISITLGIMSFLPKLTPPWGNRFPKENSNILYFGHICSFTEQSYLDKFYSLMEIVDKHPMDKHYSNQIVVNSKIAFIKYSYFRVAAWITISVFITPIGAWLLHKFMK